MSASATLNAELDILDTTLRDGSYVVDFQFTAADTAWMSAQLEAAGINWIEIGHGLGLGASREHRAAAASDADYIRAARGALKKAKLGMFCIPGLATLDDLKTAADLGMDFVRVGTNVDGVKLMEPFIKLARDRGLRVCTNFMKSFTTPPAEFAVAAKAAEDFGSQMNYLVDSVGGMLPSDVRAYGDALQNGTTIPWGFHGHDNIRLATANSLVAVENGALWIDTTLFGVGRGSGNAATELVVALLQQRYGTLKHIDIRRLVSLAENQALPLTHHRRQEVYSMSLGLAQVHSLFLEKILARASAEMLDGHDLIHAVGAIDRLNCEPHTLDRAVAAVRRDEQSDLSAAGGFFSLEHDGTAEDALRAGENVAEKLGVPCLVWISNGGDRIAVTQTAEAIEIRLSGDPVSIGKAVTRPTTKIMLAPELASFKPKLSRENGPTVSVAELAATR